MRIGYTARSLCVVAALFCLVGPGAAKADDHWSHLDFGPLQLLTPKSTIVAQFGIGTPARFCWPKRDWQNPNVPDCDELLKYTDGRDLLVLDFGPAGARTILIELTIKRGGHVLQIAHMKTTIPPIRDWRWEGLPVFATPPSQIKGWEICDFGGSEFRGYCGGGKPNPRGLLVEYSFHNGVVTTVDFGTE